jgi:arylsulfatase A-like enzyme
MHFPHAHRSDYFTTYRLGDWKVIYHYYPSASSENSHYQLFNLVKDPFEQKNLATAEPAELTRMMKGLIVGLEKQGALYPVDVKSKEPLKPKLP